MDFTIQVPANYAVEEKLGGVKIISNNNSEITIGFNSTNYDNLKDYYNNSPNRFNDRVKQKNDLEINGLQGIKSLFEDHVTYFIYTKNRVYIISTSFSSLYSDLDQIALSFRYTPN